MTAKLPDGEMRPSDDNKIPPVVLAKVTSGSAGRRQVLSPAQAATINDMRISPDAALRLMRIFSFLSERRSPLTPARGSGFDCGLKVELS